MKKIRNGIVLFALFSLASCMDEDMRKLSGSIDANPAMAIPLIHSTTTLVDLLPDDEHISEDDDGAIRITYRQDSIAQVFSDSLLRIDDQAPTEEDFQVGAIDLATFVTTMEVKMTDLTSNLQDPVLVNQINEGIALTESSGLGKAYFPPITPQSGGAYEAQGSDKFQFVVISEGSLEIEITNNLAIDISTLQLRLKNAVDGSVIGTFDFTNIATSTSLVASIQMVDVTMYSDLEMEIVELSSDGSGTDPFDQSLWVPMSDEDDLSIEITGAGMVATSGMVKFLQQYRPDDTFIVDMDFEEDVVISFIDLSAGNFIYTYNSDLNTILRLTITIPQLVDDANTIFTQIIDVENSGFQEFSVPLDAYNFDFSASTNQLEVSYSSEILETTEFVAYDEANAVNLTIGMRDLEFDLVEGYFGKMEEIIEEDILDLDISALENLSSGIRLESPNLRFTAENGMGIPFDIDLQLVGVNDNEMISLNGPVLEIDPEATTVTDFNSANSSLVDLLAMNPTEMRYSGTVLSNPNNDGVLNNTIRPNTDITIGFEMDLPLYLRIEDALTTDTLALDFVADEGENSTIDFIESVLLKFHIENEFPLDVKLTVFFTDSVSGSVLDSLNLDLLDAAEVDLNGRTIAPNIYERNIQLNSDQIDALFNANRALLDIRMNSYDYENVAVRLYTDYELVIDVGVILELKTEE